MQGTGANGIKRKVVFVSVNVVLLIVFIFLDQITKKFFAGLYERQGTTTVIDNFFRLTHSENTGAGFSFLADKSWAQTVFKILTPVALLIFTGIWIYSFRNGLKWLAVSVVFIVSGTIGNFIDRLVKGSVCDFLSFQFGSYYFPTFNLADTFLTVGVIMVIFYFLFLDKNAVLKKNDGKENS